MSESATHSKPAYRYHFDSFCVDATKRVLLRDGNRVVITGKSLDTLLALVERAGQTVTKRELIRAVWGSALVDENNLNQCISALRKTLGEQPRQHEYIVTVSGVGYRFVAPVSRIEVEAPSPEPEGTGVLLTDAPSGRRFPFRILVALAALTLLSFALYALHDRWSAAGNSAKRRTAVILNLQVLPATPENAWLSTAIGEMLYHELAGPGSLRMIAPDDAARMQRELPRRNSAAESLRDIQNYTQADFALGGAVTVLTDQVDKPLRIDLHLQDLRSGEILATTSSDGSEQNLFTLIHPLSDRIRQTLGIEATASRPNSPLPAKPPAMQLYADGVAALRSSDFLTAKDRLLKAVEADPSNALCYAALSSAWSGLGYEANAAAAARRAFELSGSLQQLDRLAIEGRYRMSIHDWPRAAEIYRSTWKLVPDSIEDALALAEVYRTSGQIDSGRHVFASLRSLPAPLRDDPRIDLEEARFLRSTWSDYPRVAQIAGEAARKARGRHMLELYANALLVQASALIQQGDARGAAVHAEAKQVCQDLRDLLCLAQISRGEGNAFLLTGKLAQARDTYGQALVLLTQIGNRKEQIDEYNGLGLMHFWMDDFSASDADFREALRAADDTGRPYPETLINYTGLLLASGRLAEADRSIETALSHARKFQEVDSEANSLSLRAQWEMLTGHPRDAVATTKQALLVAKRSGAWDTALSAQIESARALAITGDYAGAKNAIATAETYRGHGLFQDIDLDFNHAQVLFYQAAYPEAERLAGRAAERARGYQDRELETRAESLLALDLLAQGHIDEAYAASARLTSAPQGTQLGLSSLEARLAMLAVSARRNPARSSAAVFQALASDARRAGYAELAFEIRLAGARPGQASDARKLESEAAALGYGSVASRAHNVAGSIQ